MPVIFAPPIMAVKGLLGVESAFSRELTSPLKRNPKYLSFGKYSAIIAVEACALCAVPKASFT